jgi:hypothetical protein
MLESAWLPLTADAVVAVLLIVTLVFVGRLNNRLSALRADRGALAELIQGLQHASQQAERAVGGLKLSANDSGRALEGIVERAGALRDDLTFLIGRAEAAADRLEGAVRGRQEPPPPAETSRAPGPTSSNKRLSSLLRQAAASERSEPVVRMADFEQTPDETSKDQARQSRSERELQRALLGRR